MVHKQNKSKKVQIDIMLKWAAAKKEYGPDERLTQKMSMFFKQYIKIYYPSLPDASKRNIIFPPLKLVVEKTFKPSDLETLL